MNDLLKIVYKAMDEKQAEDLVVVDFREQSAFVDYFIIGTARNQRLAKAIIEEVEDKILCNNGYIKHKYVEDTSKWFLLDAGNIVCHIFYDNERENYNLEGLWKDLPTIKM